jgi:uncharacterized damage-inducible protein DinB
MKTEIQKIGDILRHTFEKNAWHGLAVMEVLNSIDEHIVHKKFNSTHSIIELVAHMTAWRTFVIEELSGNSEYKVSEEMNFPVIDTWQEAVYGLMTSQEKLLASLAKFPDERLGEVVPNRPYKFFTMLHGIVHHDLYHLGQIVMISKIGNYK